MTVLKPLPLSRVLFPPKNPQTATEHQPKFPFNTTDLELSPPFVVLSSSSSSDTEADTVINTVINTAINPPNIHDKRFFGYSTSYNVNRKIKPYCPSPKSEHRTCATQKEVDQGWHDTDGCHRVLAIRFLGFNIDKCWVAGARCIKKNCRY
ncbi:hypothetical protein DID88_009698 [Monilinia fructigena]|uniref:Uncharacterized protein n=1 Tax=Monilinia fructigena TaxID=38457 RepID=A0A395ICJ4_9HELO|nr:hypothetical protein DID88_009698 [Monilinia fructigena]